MDIDILNIVANGVNKLNLRIHGSFNWTLETC